MKLLFSEAQADYARYLYPYVIWAVPEGAETPADLFSRGFLPASPQLDRFYLCRNVRVDLQRYKPSSENRRILRKGMDIGVALVTRDAFDYTPERRERWKRYADHRFGADVMSHDRLDRLMSGPVISHLLCFTNGTTGAEVGTALLYVEPPRLAFYYYAFYDLEFLSRNLGMYMMTRAVQTFVERGVAHLHLGTCYSERALYKTQFEGVEFFNGHRWSDRLDELKHMLRREHEPDAGHLLQSTSYLDLFHDGRLDRLADLSQFRV